MATKRQTVIEFDDSLTISYYHGGPYIQLDVGTNGDGCCQLASRENITEVIEALTQAREVLFPQGQKDVVGINS